VIEFPSVKSVLNSSFLRKFESCFKLVLIIGRVDNYFVCDTLKCFECTITKRIFYTEIPVPVSKCSTINNYSNFTNLACFSSPISRIMG
jgi:hypothetical protein